MPTNLEVPNDWATTLRSPLADVPARTFEPIPLASAAGLNPSSTVPLRVDDELILLVSAVGTLDPIGYRGWDGSEPGAHAAGAQAEAVWTKKAVASMKGNLPRPGQANMFTWVAPPENTITTAQNFVSGTLYTHRHNVNDPGFLASVLIYISTAMVNATYARIGVYDLDGVLRGQSADLATVFSTTGSKEVPIIPEAGQDLFFDEDFYTGVMGVGQTAGAAPRIATVTVPANTGLNTGDGVRFAANSGNAALPNPLVISSLSPSSTPVWIGTK